MLPFSTTSRLPLLVRLLPWAAVLLPSLILVVGAWATWGAAWRDARAELTRSADAAAEYSTRVLGAHVQFTGRVNDLVRGLSDDQIRADEARLHLALAQLTTELPQAESSHIISRDGENLVSSIIYPVPRGLAPSRGRDYMLALAAADAQAVHVSQIYTSRIGNQPFFAISRRRDSSGSSNGNGFNGVVSVSVRPTQLAASTRQLLGGTTDSSALIRSDGQMLMRTLHDSQPLPTLAADNPFYAMVSAGHRSTIYQIKSPVDGRPLLVVLRKLENFPLYASATRPRAAIVGAWRDSVVTHLTFGLPTIIALLLLSVQVRRDHRTLIRNNDSLERRVAERTAELQEFSDALDLSVTMIMRRDGSVVHWSLGCARLYGFSDIEMRSRNRRTVTDYLPGEREAILAVVDRDGEWRGELRQRHKDGSPMVVLSHWIARDTPEGQRLVCQQTDITAQHRLQSALADSEERFRTTFEQAAIGMAHVALDGSCLRANHQLCAMLGYSRKEMLTKRFQDLTHADDLAATMAHLQSLLAGETGGYTIEKRYWRKDGALLWAAVTASVMRDAQGRPLHIISAIADITEHKLGVQALADSEDRLRLAQEVAGIGTWENAEPGDHLSWSAQTFTLFGFDPRQPHPSTAEAMARIHPDDRARVTDEIASAMAGAEFRSEFRVLHPLPEGGTRQLWLAALGRRLPARAPHHVRLLGVNFDITERKRVEEHNALLMREVDHRGKNALAVVQAALRLTKAASQADYIRAVEGRVAALARAHTVLARQQWQGAELRSLLEAELLPFMARDAGAEGPRVSLDGPPVMLEATATQALCMALHELATNAVKYGALSQPGGLIQVDWRLASGMLCLSWRESGGPPTTEPGRRGFGSRVIEKTIIHQLSGTLNRSWNPGGLIVNLCVSHGAARQSKALPRPVAAA